MRSIVAIIAVLAASLQAQAADLAKLYPATLDFFEGQPTREWTCTKDDVWALKSFVYEFDDKLKIELGPSNVVCGVHDKNVVWAALIPDKPGTVTAGDRSSLVASIWMRFNPSHLGALFPEATVIGNGAQGMIVWGKRICAWKINSGWQAGNLPVIPKKSSLVFDIDTPQGERHYFMVDTDKGTLDHVDAFNNRALPALVSFEPEQSLRAFDTVWDAFDREYAKFIIRPDVDWNECRERYRAAAANAKSTYEAGAAIGALLTELRDLHIFVKVGNEFVPGYNRPRPLNASWQALPRLIGGLTDTKQDISWGRTDDAIGYINVYALNRREVPSVFDDVLEQLAETWGLVIDLRFNGGGDELLGREIAGRFLDHKRTYSMSQYRSGPKHDELGPKYERAFEPRGPWLWEAPVVVLWGQRTMSSAESFALMFAQCPNVTTMGDRTAGASANPRRIELEGGIVVNLPRWLDLDHNGNSIEDVGVEPQIKVEAKPEEFTPASDPVLEKALEHLRKVPEAQRKTRN
ncbi:MAG: S41 family peptidase [Phycisphaerales bacterium]|nr:S41 family peptidase [Phycisphaerales bacterium]MCI0676726.1 S41 family peptidase [Phycisphaerales bacterium]